MPIIFKWKALSLTACVSSLRCYGHGVAVRKGCGALHHFYPSLATCMHKTKGHTRQKVTLPSTSKFATNHTSMVPRSVPSREIAEFTGVLGGGGGVCLLQAHLLPIGFVTIVQSSKVRLLERSRVNEDEPAKSGGWISCCEDILQQCSVGFLGVRRSPVPLALALAHPPSMPFPFLPFFFLGGRPNQRHPPTRGSQTRSLSWLPPNQTWSRGGAQHCTAASLEHSPHSHTCRQRRRLPACLSSGRRKHPAR